MKVYRIYHPLQQRFMYSLSSRDGVYFSLETAKKARSQFSRYFRKPVLIIVEYEMIKTKEIE